VSIDDRHVRGLGRAAQPAADLQPRYPLDHPVEQDDVRRRFTGEQQRLLAVGRVLDVEILALKVPFQRIGQRRIVLDQQQASLHHRAGLAGRMTGS
jgi:hypothetical protein